MRKVLGVLLGVALVLPVTAAWAEYESGDHNMAVDKAPAVFVAPAPVTDGTLDRQISISDSRDLR